MERRRDGKIAESNYLSVSPSLRLSVSPSLRFSVSFLICWAPLVIALALAPALSQENISNPVVWALKAGAAPDGSMTAELTAKIEDGWHLYSLTPIANGPKPTRITLPSEQAFELAGEIEAPDPFVETDPNIGDEVEYYEESVTFKLPLKRRAGRSGDRLIVEARYQVCTNQLCLPPKTVKLEADVK
jgi:DsbC/DsbD-like thiol-disulfide interchange protein